MRRSSKRWGRTLVALLAAVLAMPGLLLMEQSAQLAHAAGASYYVSTTGNDTTGAGTLASPWRTIQKASTVATAGDTVYIRSGTYRETVTPTNSGTVGNPITYTAYNNESVTVSGADVVSGTWTVHSGNVYKTTAMNWTLGRGMDQIFVSGNMMTEARWPNSTDINKPVFKTVATTTTRNTTAKTVSFTDTANLTQASGYWNGASLFMHIYNGFPQTGIINTYTTGTIQATMDTSPDYESAGGTKSYYIFGHLNALDTAKEFFRDSAGTLYLWTADGTSPAGYTIEAKKREYAFNLTGRSYVTIKGISLKAATITTNSSFDYATPSTHAATAHHIVIDDIDAQYVSHFNTLVGGGMWVGRPYKHGLFLAGSDHTVKNSTINWSAGNGVYIGDGANNKVLNNTISNVGYTMAGAAVDSGSSDEDDGTVDHANEFGEVAYNTIHTFGKIGISMSGIKGGSIHHNELYNGLLQVADAGAIYGWNRDTNRLEIAYNRVRDMNAGVISGNKTGIYLDNRMRNAIVHHNLTYNVQRALILNMPGASFPKDGQFRYVYNNTFDATSLGMTYSPTGTTEQDWGQTYLKNNIFTRGFFPADGNTKGMQQNNLYSGTSPLFVNAAAGNYTLQSTSPAINAGQVIGGITDGYASSAPDVGAFESGAAAWTAGAGTMPSDAETITSLAFTATEDAFVRQDAATTNYNGTQRLYVRSSGTAAQYGYVKFNVTGITGKRIRSIKLRLTESSTDAAGNTNWTVNKTTSAWSESTVTWNTKPATDAVATGSFTLAIHGAGYDSSIGENTVMELVLDRTAFSTDGTVGLALLPLSGANPSAYMNRDTAAMPQLIVDYYGTGGTPDTQPPTAPANLASPSKTSNSVNLSWSASTDNVGVAGYDVYRGATRVNASLVTSTSYIDTGLAASTAYTYTVKAKDAAGNESAASSSLGVTTNAASGNRNAYSTVEAESYNAMSGISQPGTYIGSFDNNDWIRYDNVDFGSNGAASVTIRLAVPAAYAGQQIQLRLGSTTGTLIGTLTTAATADFNTYAAQSTAVSGATGVQTLFLVASGTSGIANLDWLTFTQSSGSSTVLSEGFDGMTSNTAPAGWTVSTPASTTATVAELPSPTDKSLQLTDANAANRATASKSFTNQTGTFTWEWSYYLTSGTKPDFKLLSGSTDAVVLTHDTTGQLSYTNASGTPINFTAVSGQTWNTIKVIADPATDTFDLYLNNTLELSNAPFRNAVGGIDAVLFQTCYGCTTSVLIDDLSITN